MNPLLLSILAVVLAYLVGAIPFSYILVYGLKGIDIRTVGSGNVGATNAARVLGVWFFPLIMALDALKGYLPTIFFPMAAAALSGVKVPQLNVFVALAAILGHNYPVYLRFRGGKGVATSLGAVGALDGTSMLVAGASFVAFLLVTRYISMSSALAATVFLVVHFSITPQPFARSNLAMTVVTLLLWGMMMARHRNNFVRIAAGTEPKVLFRKRSSPPAGRIRPTLLVLLAGATLAALALVFSIRPRPLDCGAFVLKSVSWASTGHQRAERLAFAGGGRRLAVTCPRYYRVVVYSVTERRGLERVNDVDVGGRAVALWPLHDRFLVLVRPGGDSRHVEAGWLQAIDLQGQLIGSRLRVGFDPDDLVVDSEERWALVLLSGNAEGETNRPGPELITIDLHEPSLPRVVGRVPFTGQADNPDRIFLSASGHRAAVSLLGSNQVAALDVADPVHPRLISRQPLTQLDLPYPDLSRDDWIMMPAASERDAVLVTLPGEPGPRLGLQGSYLIGTLPEGSGLEVMQAAQRRTLGRLTLRGRANLGTIRPAGVAYCAERGLIAVANRSGGSVHLVAIEPKAPPDRRVAVRSR